MEDGWQDNLFYETIYKSLASGCQDATPIFIVLKMKKIRWKLGRPLSRCHFNQHGLFNEAPEINLYYLKDSYQRDFFNYKTNEI